MGGYKGALAPYLLLLTSSLYPPNGAERHARRQLAIFVGHRIP